MAALKRHFQCFVAFICLLLINLSHFGLLSDSFEKRQGRSHYLGGRSRGFWEDRWTFRLTELGSVITKSPKGEITKCYKPIQLTLVDGYLALH